MANQRITGFGKVTNFSSDDDLIPIIINTGTVPLNATITKANFINAISLGSYVDLSTNQTVGGNKTFSGQVTLNGGVTFNLGSSSDFLKADGSIDSNTYLTASSIPKRTYNNYLAMKADQSNQTIGEYYRVLNASDDPGVIPITRSYTGGQTYALNNKTGADSDYAIFSSDKGFTDSMSNEFSVVFAGGVFGGRNVSLDYTNIDGSQIGFPTDVAKTSLTLSNSTGTLDYQVDRGRLLIGGIITTDAATTANKVIATLPVGARPSSERYAPSFNASTGISQLLIIGTNGDITVKDGVGNISLLIDSETTLNF